VAASEAAQARLVLAGGALPVCSSLAREACRIRIDWPDTALLATHYRIDPPALARLAAATWPNDAERGQRVLEALARHPDGRRIDEARLRAAVDRALSDADAPPSGWDTLTGPERDFLHDHLETTPLDRQGRRLTEHVRLDATRVASAAAVYGRIVELARAGRGDDLRPRVLVVTASSRDPFAAVDFYTGLFTEAGADVAWLPLDAALARAIMNGRCEDLDALRASEHGSWDRARIYPDGNDAQRRACADPASLIRAIDGADAVFLNGGDQSLQYRAWIVDGKPTPAYERLLARVRSGALVLAGTSAGTAVQSRRTRPGAAMVTNGSSSAALGRGAHAAPPPPVECRGAACGGLAADALTWDTRGGLGTFDAGLLDTHFSERGRQWRLMVLLEVTRAPLGLGIDEGTAVVALQSARGWRFETIGAGTAQLFERTGRLRFRLVRMPTGSGVSWPLAPTVDQCAVSTPLLSVDPDRADFDRAIAVLGDGDHAGGIRVGAGAVIAHVCPEPGLRGTGATRRYVVRIQD
jgi:cyanophycinase